MDTRQATRHTHERPGFLGRVRHLALAVTLGLTLGGNLLGGITPVAPAAAASDCTGATEFVFAERTQCFQVPDGITSVTFDVYGAQGGAGGTVGAYAVGTGGLGGAARATLAVTPGQRFAISVGRKGGDGSLGVWDSSHSGGDGGASVDGKGGLGADGMEPGTSSGGGGGGGATDVRPSVSSGSFPGPETRLIVAGGGGGGGGVSAGAGTPGAGGAGGGGAGAGDSNPDYWFHANPGQGGTATGGGAGGFASGAGSLGQGGSSVSYSGAGGGGGGGGYYGGGAGASNILSYSGAGGGGGGSYGPVGTTFSPGVNAGNGKVLISYASSVALRSSANPSLPSQNPTYTATINPARTGGYVSFQRDGHLMVGCTMVPVVDGSASCTGPSTSNLVVGTHQIVATFSGSGPVQAGASAALSQTVIADTTTELDVSGPDGQAFTLGATVYAYGAQAQTPLGPVTFSVDGQPFQTILPRPAGDKTARATLTTTALPAGAHTITATYQGDSASQASVSQGGGARVAVPASLMVNDTAGGVAYSGQWIYSAGRGVRDYQDDVHATARAGDSFSFTFTGTGIVYIAEKSADQGVVDIYLDGKLAATVDTRVAARNVAQQAIYSNSTLPAGSHTITVVNRSDGAWMLLDAFKVVR